MLADLYRDYGEYDQALENYQAAQDILYKTKDTSELFNVLAAVGGFYRTQRNTRGFFWREHQRRTPQTPWV